MLKIELFIVLIIYGLLQGQARLSIHQLEMEIYNTQNISLYDDELIPLFRSTESNQTLDRTVFGYYPYWMGSAWLDLDYSLLSTIAYFGAEANSTGGIDDWHSWPPNNLITFGIYFAAHSF